jgi:hypothetical protein
VEAGGEARRQVLWSDGHNYHFVESTRTHDLWGSRAATKYFTQGCEVEFEGRTFMGWPHGAPSWLWSQGSEPREASEGIMRGRERKQGRLRGIGQAFEWLRLSFTRLPVFCNKASVRLAVRTYRVFIERCY